MRWAMSSPSDQIKRIRPPESQEGEHVLGVANYVLQESGCTAAPSRGCMPKGISFTNKAEKWCRRDSS